MAFRPIRRIFRGSRCFYLGGKSEIRSEVCFSRLCDLLGRRWSARPALFFRCKWKSPRRMFFIGRERGLYLAVIFRSKKRSIPRIFLFVVPPNFLTSLELFIDRFLISFSFYFPRRIFINFPPDPWPPPASRPKLCASFFMKASFFSCYSG